jgi:hypothetical protein
MMTLDINNEAVMESIRQELARKTGKQVERVDGIHNLRFGAGAIFRVCPVGNTHIFVIFRPSVSRQGSPASASVKEIDEALKYLTVTEPHVIEVNEEGVHPARHERSYGTKAT